MLTQLVIDEGKNMIDQEIDLAITRVINYLQRKHGLSDWDKVSLESEIRGYTGS